MMRQATPDRRGLLFTKLWTLKETFVKATGEGLRRSLDDFSFMLDPIAIRFRGAWQTGGHDWQFTQLCLGPNRSLPLPSVGLPSSRSC